MPSARMRPWMFAALAALVVPAPALAQSTARCVDTEWRPSARDLLAAGVTLHLTPPPRSIDPRARARARPLLAAMREHVRAFRAAPLAPASAHVLMQRETLLRRRHVVAIDALAVRASALRDAATTVEALVLHGELHELAATRLARFPMLELWRPSPAEECRGLQQARWDTEVSTHRMVAIVLYATAVHLAREHRAVTARAWWATDRLLDEDNRQLREEALGYQRLFEPAAGEFDLPSPGAVVLETRIVHGARLAPR